MKPLNYDVYSTHDELKEIHETARQRSGYVPRTPASSFKRGGHSMTSSSKRCFKSTYSNHQTYAWKGKMSRKWCGPSKGSILLSNNKDLEGGYKRCDEKIIIFKDDFRDFTIEKLFEMACIRLFDYHQKRQICRTIIEWAIKIFERETQHWIPFV